MDEDTNDSIRQHVLYYYSLLKGNPSVKISQLIDSYKKMQPILHSKISDEKSVDVPVLLYSLSRLPEAIFDTDKVILSPSLEATGLPVLNIKNWQLTSAKARRRINYFNVYNRTLISIVNSDSDIDDIINCLIAYQVELLKIVNLINGRTHEFIKNENYEWLGITLEDWNRLKGILTTDWPGKIISWNQQRDLTVCLSRHDEKDFQASIDVWWSEISKNFLMLNLSGTPVYFISSNLHSCVNIVGGYPTYIQDAIYNYLEEYEPELYKNLIVLRQGQDKLRINDLLYFISSKYFSNDSAAYQKKIAFESQLGIKTIFSKNVVMCNLQVIPISSLAKSSYTDPSLNLINKDKLLSSNSVIINIDYPLGCLAGYILTTLMNYFTNIKGIYVIGKAATLTASIGDIQIPSEVFDSRTSRTYCLKDIKDNHEYQADFQILKNQKSYTVYSTFLQNEELLKKLALHGINIIEMEAGPYLQSIAAKTNNLNGNNVDLQNLPFDLEIINYASDNPLTQSLAQGSLQMKGIEPTYISTLSVIQRIIDLETG